MIEITLPLPPKQLHPNGRCHYMAKARAVKKARWEAGIAAVAALEGRKPPRWEKATVQATFYVAKKGDGDGRNSSLKAALDGLQDAGIVANDSGLTVLPPLQVLDPRRGGQRKVVLRIEAA